MSKPKKQKKKAPQKALRKTAKTVKKKIKALKPKGPESVIESSLRNSFVAVREDIYILTKAGGDNFMDSTKAIPFDDVLLFSSIVEAEKFISEKYPEDFSTVVKRASEFFAVHHNVSPVTFESTHIIVPIQDEFDSPKAALKRTRTELQNLVRDGMNGLKAFTKETRIARDQLQTQLKNREAQLKKFNRKFPGRS